MAGACAELAHKVLRTNFRNIDTAETRIILIEGGEGVLAAFDWTLSNYARRKLESMGVEVRLGDNVEDVSEEYVVVGGEKIPCANVVWGAGVQASPITKTLGSELGPGGRIAVEPDLSIPDHPNAFAALRPMVAIEPLSQ